MQIDEQTKAYLYGFGRGDVVRCLEESETYTGAASKLGISRHALYRILKKSGNGDWGGADWEEDSAEGSSYEEALSKIKPDLSKWEVYKWTVSDGNYWFRFRRRQLDLREYDNFIEELEKIGSRRTVPKTAQTNFDTCVISYSDVHVGCKSWDGEGSVEEHIQDVYQALVDCAEFASTMASRAVLIVGGDYLHVDTAGGTTTKGTQVGSPDEIFNTFPQGLRLLIESVEYLAEKFSSVEVICVSGNHDKVVGFTLAHCLKAYFRKWTQVYIDADPDPVKYRLYGNVLIGTSHGENTKDIDVPANMAIEAKSLWSQCNIAEFFLHHLHHERVLEKGGVIVRRLPALAPLDRYAKTNGFLSNRSISAFVYSYDGKTRTERKVYL